MRQVLIHRSRVFSLPADTPGGAGPGSAGRFGAFPSPVVQSHGLDDVVGVVHLRDLLGEHGTAADAASAPMVVPDACGSPTPCGGSGRNDSNSPSSSTRTARSTESSPSRTCSRRWSARSTTKPTSKALPVPAGPDGSLALPGSFPVHDLPDIGVAIDDAPRGDYVTVAGFALAALGQVPRNPVHASSSPPGHCMSPKPSTMRSPKSGSHHAEKRRDRPAFIRAGYGLRERHIPRRDSRARRAGPVSRAGEVDGPPR